MADPNKFKSVSVPIENLQETTRNKQWLFLLQVSLLMQN